MKHLFIAFFLSVLPIFGKAQTEFQFFDESNESIVGIKLTVLSLDEGILFRGISDDFGKLSWEHSLHKEQVQLVAKMSGFKTMDTLVFIQSEMDFIMESDALDQEEVIVTAQYGTSTTEKSVHRVKVIDRTKMDAMGAVNLKDVLTNELGVRLAQDNILGSSMTLQGISGENVKILIDGVPVVGRLDGNIDLSQINLQEIERIEIVEGPLSVNYGTNALAGVINLISKKPNHNKLSGSAMKYYESTGHFNVTGNLDFGGKHWGAGISGGRNFFDGWHTSHQPFKNPIPIADSNRFMSWKPKEQLFGGLYLQRNKAGWMIRYKAQFFNEFILNRGYPRPPYQETAFDDTYNTRRIDNSLNIKKKVGKAAITKHTFAYNRYDRIKNTYFVDLTTLDQSITANSTDHDTSVFDQWIFRGSYARSMDSAKINFEVGYDVLIESAEGKRILKGRQEQGDFALFTSAQYRPIESLVIRPGLRYAYNTTYKTPVLPSLNLKWEFAKNWNFRTSYARGFRAPGIKELYFEFVDINHNIVGSDSLSAENSHNLLASFHHDWTKNATSIQTEIGGFYNSINNRISLAAVSGTEFTYVNIGAFKSNGVRISTKIQRKNLTFNVGGAFIGRASDLVSNNLINTFIYYPEVQSSAIYTIKKKGTSVSFFYKYQGELPSFSINENDEVEQVITEDYHLLDLTFSQRIWKDRLKLTVGSKNLLNVTQIVSAASSGVAHSATSNSISVGTGRSYFASLKLQLSKKIKNKKP
ncbi:MAG: TonB-dependent receptor [Flavobacteriales bacterium]|nr:TonB-dependent receptor [Flavobacteriales bacterium]